MPIAGGGTALPGETALHQRGKQQLAAWAHSRGWQPRLEVYLPAIQQRADLLVTIRGRQVALEFQCSGLSCQRLAARNAGYRQLGIHPVWLLGPAYRRSLRAAKRAQFTQLRGGRPVLLYWQVETGRLLVEEGRIAAQAQPVVGDSLRQLARLRFGLSQTAAGILARQPAGVCLRQAPVWFPDLVSKQAALQRLQGKKAGWSAEANHPAGEEPD